MTPGNVTATPPKKSLQGVLLSKFLTRTPPNKPKTPSKIYIIPNEALPRALMRGLEQKGDKYYLKFLKIYE